MITLRGLLFRLLIALSLLAPHGAAAETGEVVICGANGPVAIDWIAPGDPGPAPAAAHQCCKGLCAAAPPPAPTLLKEPRQNGALALRSPHSLDTTPEIRRCGLARAPPARSV